MDLQSQAAIARLAKTHGCENLVVLLGAPDPESAEIAAETVVLGDPACAGALAETQLGLDVYHILEDEIRAALPVDIYDEQVGVMADVLEPAELAAAVAAVRAKAVPPGSAGAAGGR
jgi:glycine/sarcosine/betaine reductase complex component A